jgi:hypothetical protein
MRYRLVSPDGVIRSWCHADTLGEAAESLMPGWMCERGLNSLLVNVMGRDKTIGGVAAGEWLICADGAYETKAEELRRLAGLYEDIASELDDDPETTWARRAYDSLSADYYIAADALDRIDALEELDA